MIEQRAIRERLRAAASVDCTKKGARELEMEQKQGFVQAQEVRPHSAPAIPRTRDKLTHQHTPTSPVGRTVAPH